KAARDALKSAIAGLGEQGEAPNNVLEDVTTLADGLIATISTAIGGAKAPPPAPSAPEKPAGKVPLKAAPKPQPPAATCPTKAAVTPSPETRRALAKLGDVRRRILGHPRYKDGDSTWVRRTRLLVTLLSDAMDVALKEDKRLSFVIPADLAEKNITEGLRDW